MSNPFWIKEITLSFGGPDSRDPFAVDAHLIVAGSPEPIRVQGKSDQREYNVILQALVDDLIKEDAIQTYLQRLGDMQRG